MKSGLVLLLIFFYGAQCHRLPFFLKQKSCLTHDCVKNINNGFDTVQPPCTNFYQHVCKRWNSEHGKPPSEPFWNQYSATRAVIYARIKHLLETRDNVENSKQFYEVCMKAENEDHAGEFSELIAKLGGWSDESSDFQGYNYLEHVVEVTKLLSVHPILKFHVDTDSRNNSRSALYIEPGSYAFPEMFLVNPTDHPGQLKVYREWIEKTLQASYPNTTLQFQTSAEEVVDFETELAQLSQRKGERKRVPTNALHALLGAGFGKIPHFLFENTHVDHKHVSHVFTHPDYLQSLNKFISETEPRIVSNYIVWSAIKDIARAVSSKLRIINFEVDRAILGVTEDLARSDECIQNGLEFFSLELASPYTSSYLSAKTISRVRYMARSIKKEFIQMLENAKWLSGRTKYSLIKRAVAVKFDIGYSNNVIDASFLNIDFHRDYFLTMLKLKGLKSRLNFNSLQSVKLRWPSHIFEVNAFYNVPQNAIILPLGILHPPFYEANNNPASNYGALGVLIGHELSHSLDSLTSTHKTWPATDSTHFKAQTSCFKKQYDSFGIDGSYTINENIADAVGIRASYHALLSHTGELSPLQKHTFFINFTQMWCEVSGQDQLLLEEHAPVQFRVTGVLQNFREFKNAFRCGHLNSFNCNLW